MQLSNPEKKYAYISIYATNVGMLFGFEDHVNKILAPNRSEAFSITKKPVDILLSKTSWFHERSSPDFRDG